MRMRTMTMQTGLLKRWWNDYALALVLALLFLLSWLGQFVTGEGHALASEFWNATFENWQSEFLQLLSFVIATKYLIFVGSPQSKDGDEKIIRMLEYLQKEVSQLRDENLSRLRDKETTL